MLGVAEYIALIIVIVTAVAAWTFVILYWGEPWRKKNRQTGWSLWLVAFAVACLQSAQVIALFTPLDGEVAAPMLFLSYLLLMVTMLHRLIFLVRWKMKRRRALREQHYFPEDTLP